MKIAFDVSPLESGHRIRGIGFYTRNLALWLKKLSKTAKWSFDEINSESKIGKSVNYNLIHFPYFDLFFVSLPIIKKRKWL